VERRQVVLLALIGALVVALYVLGLGVGAGQSDRADPSDAGGIEAIDAGVGAVPGIGSALTADQVDTGCFSGDTFQVVGGAAGGCGFAVPEGVDRVDLQFLAGNCTIEVSGQADVIDHDVDRSDFDADGRGRLAIAGDGAVVRLLPGTGAGGCTLRLIGD
jgi:hypothetical protein